MRENSSSKLGIRNKIEQVGRLDLPGGGQVVVEDGYAYIGHMLAPHGTSIIDVQDLKRPQIVAQLEVPEGIRSHKVQVNGDIMLINYERFKTEKKPQGGLKVFAISDKARPREIAFFKVAGSGVHRFTFDGRYAYISPTMEGYVGNIVMILDLKDPAHPEEVSRWWMPGQWIAGGETPDWHGTDHRCHHPIRRRDRLYVSYWLGGVVILDISDVARPKLVSRLDWSPPYACPTHTTLPIPYKILDRDFLLVTDEETQDKLVPGPSGFLWMVDIMDEKHPIPVSTFMVPHDGGSTRGNYFGSHQPAEQVYDNVHYVIWFAGGLRALDILNPYQPKEVGYYIPFPGKGQTAVQSNDVFRREDGLLFLVDRLNGFEILESQF